jgi:hypothetical protein
MTVELNWHEGDDQAGVVWEHEAAPLPVALPRPAAIAEQVRDDSGPSRVQLMLLGAGIGIVLGLLALGALLLWRANEGNQLARQDVAAAAASLLEAQAAGDVQRYAALLDSSDQAWKARLVAGLRHPDRPQPVDLTIERVRLNGNLAEAQVVEFSGDEPLRRVAFFRLAEGQWRLAPPAPAVFGAEQQASTTHFRIHYRQQDQRFLPALTNLAEGTYVALCGELRCTAGSRPLELRLLYDAQADNPPLTPGVVAVASPSLAGWQANGEPAVLFSQRLAGQIAMQMAAQKAPRASDTLLELVGAWAMEQPANGRAAMDDALATMDPIQGLMSLERAWAAVVRRNSNDWLARTEIGSVLRFAQNTWGSDAVGRLLENTSGSFNEMTRRAFQVDGPTFQQMWLVWLAQQQTPEPGISTG